MPEEAIVANQNQIPPTVPNANKDKSLPWFLWFFAGCGFLGLVLIPILMVIVIVAVNPASRLKQAQEKAAKISTKSATKSGSINY